MAKYKTLAYFLGALLKVWFFTIQKKTYFLGKETSNILKNQDYILVTWHNQGFSLMQHLPSFLKNKQLKCMVSRSKDGEKISYLLSFFGIGNIRGSRNNGGVSGFRELIRSARKKEIVIIAADGSTGPIYQVKEGVIKLASICNIPIIHTFSISNRFFTLKSWDKHILPKLFSKQKFFYSSPFYVSEKLNQQQLEDYCLKLENFMKENQTKSI